jgi:DNA-binding GntR family transcriptional regulator
MEQESPQAANRLLADLVPRLLDLIRDLGWPPGTHLAEARLARLLGVSRTPMRAALRHLAGHGIAASRAAGGTMLADASPAARAAALSALASPAATEQERLSRVIVHDRLAGALPEIVSETELMRRYGVGRRPLQSVLRRLAAVATVERRLGHGWAFRPVIADDAARDESYRWRMIIEPAALLEPGYRVDRAWIAAMRARHNAMLLADWGDASSRDFLDMNAAFHAGLAAGAANRFLIAAVEQQNQLRRARDDAWAYGQSRVRGDIAEHIALLDRIEDGAFAAAAALLHRHLARAAASHRAPDS